MSRIVQIFLSPGHNFFGHHGQPPGDSPIVEVAEAECVAGKGLRGDRFFDYKPDYKGQITLFDWAVYERVRDEIVKGDLSLGIANKIRQEGDEDARCRFSGRSLYSITCTW